MDDKEQKALDDIERHGCHVLHVLEGDGHPEFTYSIGIEKHSGHPDVIVVGFKREIGFWVVNEYNRRVLAGETFEVDRPYAGFLEGFDVMFKEVEKVHYKEYVGWGRWLHGGNDFRVLQLVYPSTSGIWPWDENAPEGFLWYARRLYAG